MNDARSLARQRAQFVRHFHDALYNETPGTDVWATCSQLIVDLLGGHHVTFAVRDADGDRIVHTFEHGATAAADDGPRLVVPNSIVADVFAADDTVVRVRTAGDVAVGVPMRASQSLLGAIGVEGCTNDPALIMLLESCAFAAAARLQAQSILRDSARYETLAFTDGLTGLANRRRFDEALAAEWRRAIRAQTPVAMLMMDVDFFKVFNDTYGHPAGDACLQHVAKAVRESVQRPADLAARYGGEEFVALLPDADQAGGIALAERIRDNVGALQLAHRGSSLGRVSLSIGVASVIPQADMHSDVVSLAADAALYEAKRAGRNRVYAVEYVSPVNDPPVVKRNTAATNLPKPLTRLVGRTHEIAEIQALLEGEERLVTLAATGGVGKTRTSIAVATAMAQDFIDGAWFIDLARLVDPSLVSSTIGALFGLEIPAGPHASAMLVRALGSKKTLLVFDNCEHLVDAVADIAGELLQQCDEVRILATTREPLGIAGEYVYRLPLLSLPPPGPIDAAQAIAYDAVALFCDRAKIVKRDFALTDANAQVIVTICHELDGIALAIELAAARTSVITPAEIARRLSERFALLRGGDRNALPRQKTLGALIDWSYDLLSLEEQVVFRRLSVFSGGWTIDAMSAICAGDDVPNADLFELLAGLVRKSLVVEIAVDDGTRYRYLESVREYAHTKLDTDDDHVPLERRHADYFLRLANVARATHFSTASRQWFRALEPELQNCRAALAWSLVAGGDVMIGAALAGSLVSFFTQVSPSESLRWARTALDVLPPNSDPKLEGALWYAVGRSPESQTADELLHAAERTVELYRVVADGALLCEAVRQLVLVLAWYFPDQRPRTHALSLELMDLARATGDPIQTALALRSRSVMIPNTDVAEKQAVLEESLRLLMAHANDLQTAIAYMWLAEHDFCFGAAQKAAIYAREAIRYSEQSGSQSMVAQMSANLAQYSAANGDWEDAVASARTATRLASALGMDDQITWSVQALALVRASVGDGTTAARLLGFCNARIGTLHSDRQADCAEEILYRRVLAMLRTQVSDAIVEAHMLAGSGMDEAAAIRLGLSTLTQEAVTAA